ncbi:acylphosphatase [Dyella jejuensis]|uniref:acylphosphatase n=1 Tax=Dyella jejuensis TaxID=1432009 RepID=A0ABW8JJZ2_9GAMM
MSCARFLVSGKVQGVFFRAGTRQQALKFGLHGRARNLSDGRVEVVASGSVEALKQLEQWLRLGPPSARVDTVMRSDYDGDIEEGFLIS